MDVKRDDSADAYLKERLSSDLGWTIEPIGLQDVLTDASMRYGLPLMITENGVAEIQDRNRAAFIVAHLQMILASIQSGCDVLGYVDWTIADNWEWTFGYLPQARFGLFTVDRGSAGAPRYLSTGALCLGAIAAASAAAGPSFDGDLLAVLERRFGTIEPDGKRSVRQVRQSHGQWKISLSMNPRELELVIVPLQAGAWFGLSYEPASRRWFQLTQIDWQQVGGKGGRLTFTLPGKAGDRLFSAVTSKPRSATRPQLSGDVTDATGTATWTGTRRAIPPPARGKGGDAMAPTHLQLTRFEPDAPWRAAASKKQEAWEICNDVVVDEDAGTVTCTLPDGRDFSGMVTKHQLVGTIGGSTPWSGSALRDDIPFA